MKRDQAKRLDEQKRARRSELDAVCAQLSTEQRQLIEPLLDEIVNLETRLLDLRARPFIAYHPQDETRQRITPAEKVYKDCSEAYARYLRLLTAILKDAAQQDGGRMSDGELLNILDWIRTGQPGSMTAKTDEIGNFQISR